MRKIPPCKDCCDRNSTCHGNCLKYKAWKKEEEERKRVIAEAKARENIVY